MAPPRGKSSRSQPRTRGRPHPKPLLVPAEGMEQTANVQAPLTQADSFEVVRTAITVIFSEILFKKRIFPNSDYKLVYYNFADPEVNYNKLMVKDASHSAESSYPPKGHFWWHLLPRNDPEPGVQKMLRNLEGGVTDVLRQKRLRQIQLSFHPSNEDQLSAEYLAESYSIFVAYKDNEPVLYTEEEGGASQQPALMLNVRDAKKGLYDLVAKIIDSVPKAKVDGAPRHSQMSLVMTCDELSDNQPSGFHPGDESTAALLRMTRANPDLEMGTGYHGVSIGVRVPMQPTLPPGSNTVVELPEVLEGRVESFSDKDQVRHALLNVGFHRGLRPGTQDTLALSEYIEAQQSTLPQSYQDVENEVAHASFQDPASLNGAGETLVNDASSTIGDLDAPMSTQPRAAGRYPKSKASGEKLVPPTQSPPEGRCLRSQASSARKRSAEDEPSVVPRRKQRTQDYRLSSPWAIAGR